MPSPRPDATSPSRPDATPAPRPDAQQPRPSAPQSLEDIRREARENWLKSRAQPTERSAPSIQPSALGTDRQPATPTPTRAHDNDQTL
jgi:hypothetical protein